MALIDMIMPKMGESIMECTIITWLKKPGDRIEIDESMLEVATDKVDTDVPASHNGILKEVLVHDGDVVAIGAPIARIEVDEPVSGESKPDSSQPTESAQEDPDQTPKGIGDVANVPAESETAVHPEPEAATAAQEIEASISALSSRPAPVEKAVATSATTLAGSGSAVFANRFYSPLVLNIAKEEGVSPDELDRIPGSGAENRVTKKDILAYVIDRAEGHGLARNARSAQESAPAVSSEPSPKPTPAPAPPATAPKSGSVNGQADIIQMDRMRKMIAQRMVESIQTSPTSARLWKPI